MIHNAMNENTTVDPELVRRLAALGGLVLTSDQAAALAPALQELLAVDAAIAALTLDTVPATGLPWKAWSDDPDPRG